MIISNGKDKKLKEYAHLKNIVHLCGCDVWVVPSSGDEPKLKGRITHTSNNGYAFAEVSVPLVGHVKDAESQVLKALNTVLEKHIEVNGRVSATPRLIYLKNKFSYNWETVKLDDGRIQIIFKGHELSTYTVDDKWSINPFIEKRLHSPAFLGKINSFFNRKFSEIFQELGM